MCHFDMPLWMCHVSFSNTVIMSNCHAALPCRLIPCFLLISCALQCRLLPCVCCSACIMCQVPHCHAASCHVSAAVHEPLSHVSSAALPCVWCSPLAGAASAARRRMALHSPTTRGRTEPAETSVCAPRVQPRRPRQLQSQFGDCSSGASPALPSPMERR